METCQCERPDLHAIEGAYCCFSCGCYRAAEQGTPLLSLNEQAKYHYKPLGSRSSIRLVRLYGGRGDEDIRCHIVHTSLDADEVFEALSYTWGDNAALKTVHTTEGRLKITENCFRALEDLRCEGRDRVLWIDAICINQRSNLEKNHQVPLMNRIYAAATRVLIYIGRDPRPHHSEDFFRFWRTVSPDRPMRNSSKRGEVSLEQSDISHFLSQPWWSRVWILQEVAVARKALLIWGSANLEWGLFSAARVISQLYQPVDLEGNIPPVFMFSGNEPRPLNSLYSLIHTARSCRSSDPRDKIYALLNLLGGHVAHKLVADYNKPLLTLYVELFLDIVTSYNNLNILCFLGKEAVLGRAKGVETLELQKLEEQRTRILTHRERMKQFDVPDSWLQVDEELTQLADLEERIRSHPQSWDNRYAECGLETLEGKVKMAERYSNEDFPSVPWLPERRSLLYSPEESSLLSSSSANFPSWLPQLDCPSRLTSLTEIHSVPFRHARGWSSSIRICSQSAHDGPALEIQACLMARIGTRSTSAYPSDGHLTDALFLHAAIEKIPSFLQNEVIEFSKGRKPMFTRNSWVVCSYEVRAGDHVCLIDGTSALFVLRPIEGRESCRSFAFLGECYFDGLAHALSQLDPWEKYHTFSHYSEEDSQWEKMCLV